jgi:type I restriction enzyme S subunit
VSKSVELRKAAEFANDRCSKNALHIDSFVSTDNLLPNKAGLTRASSLPPQGNNLPAYRTNDILISNIRPYLRKIWFADRNGACSADVLTVRAKPEFDPKFLYYALFRDDFFAYAMKGAKGTKMPRGDKSQILDFTIPNLKKSEQKKIAAVLSALDAKIDCNNRINAELEALTKTLYDYWFVQFDFPDANGKPYKSSGGKMVYNAALKREIPEGWQVATLASITPINNDSLNPADFPEKEFKHFSIPIFDATNTYGVERGDSIGSNKFTVLGTDLLVSKLNPWFSRVIYAMDEEGQICSTELVVWRCPTENRKNFLYLIATSPQFISHCVQSATGTSNSHKRVNPAVMMRFEIPYNAKVAEEFGGKISSIIKKLIINRQENQQLAQLRDWLLPLLMNGQVTVA